ncbi:hypothetical protein BASA81_012744 [Batrachochytrium salamandrivorans]|nr:hypothetical protein BASA81_012744 [Batrachochytrium salamandrivorans]
MSVASIEKELKEIKAVLEKLKVSCKSVDELVPIQESLGRIDSSRKDGKFVDASGEIPAGQAALHDLLAECYDLKDENTKESMQKKAEDTGKSMRECYHDQESNQLVKKAMDAYDQLVKKLSEAKDTEAAKKVFEELEQARQAVQSAYQEATDPSTFQSLKGKASDFTTAVGDKVSELGSAAKDTLTEAKEKLVG